MIKFFAWEKRIESQLAEKRNEELVCIKRSKLLTIVNDNIKYACLEYANHSLLYVRDTATSYPW